MPGNLQDKVAAWATDVAVQAARLSSGASRASFFSQRRRELVSAAVAQGMSEPDAAVLADACIGGAKRILRELLRRGVASADGQA
jgi:hypothetical protein